MPTEEEMCAIVALANKAKNSYGELYDTANQYETVMKWARKWFAQRDHNRKKSREWNKAHPDRHRELNRNYYRNASKEKKEKLKEYSKKYYHEVIKPKRQAKKERKKNGKK